MLSTTSSARGAAKWVLLAPLLLFTAALIAYPLYQGVQISFFGFTLQSTAIRFTGLENYRDLFSTPDFLQAVGFTVAFAVGVTAIEAVLGVGLALLFNRDFPGKKAIFTALLLPIMIAPSMLGIMYRLLLNEDIGLVPALLAHFGLHVSLFSPSSVVPLVVVLDVLQWTPFVFLIVYSGLQSFPEEILEAAALDGAGGWRSVVWIVLPIASPVIVAAAFLRLIDAVRTFDVIYVLTAGGPGNRTTTLSIFIYKAAFESGNFGLASAASTLVMLVLVPFVPVMVKRILPGAQS